MSTEYYWKKKTIVSFILACLVVCIHTSAVDQYLIQLDGRGRGLAEAVNTVFKSGVTIVAVPLFFMIAGASFFRDYKRGMYLKKLKSRVRTNLIPFLLWNTIIMLFYIVCSYTPLVKFFLGREPFTITFKNVADAILFCKCNVVFWFILNLLIYVILTPVFDLMTYNKPIALVSLLFALTLPLYAGKALEYVHINADTVVYYLIGCIAGKFYFDDITKPSSKTVRIVSFAVCAVCLALQLLHAFEVLVLGKLEWQIMVVIFSVAFWFALDTLTENISVKRYMKYSFFIYAMHNEAQSVFVKIIYLLGPKKMWMFAPNLILSYTITIAFIILVAYLLEKYLPKVYSLLSGNR